MPDCSTVADYIKPLKVPGNTIERLEINVVNVNMNKDYEWLNYSRDAIVNHADTADSVLNTSDYISIQVKGHMTVCH